MLPTQIHQLMQQSPALQEALKQDRERVWQFLRQEASYQYVLPCERCQNAAQLLRSPYAQDLCVECLLYELLECPPIEDKYRDPRSRFYDASYDEQCKAWDPPEGVWWS